MIKKTVSIEEVQVIKEDPKTIAVNCYFKNKFVNEQLIKAGYAQPKQKVLDNFTKKHNFQTTEELEHFMGENSDMTVNERLCCAWYAFKLSKKELQLFQDLVDVSGKGSELESFIKQYKNQTFNGFIDYIIDANKHVCFINVNNKLYKFTGTFFGIQCQNNEDFTKMMSEEYLQVDLQITIVDNYNKNNLVSCVFYYLDKKSQEKYNLNVEMVEDGYAEVIQWMVKQNEKYGDELKKHLKVTNKDQTITRVQKGFQIGQTYQFEVFEISSCEFLTFMINDTLQRIYFASTITPKITQQYAEQYALESLQILRKYYGCTVSVTVDYSRENEQGIRYYGTITYNKQNVVTELIKNRYFKVLPHKVSDMNRSSDYINMLSAEKESHGLGENDEYTPQYGTSYDSNKRITIIDLSSLKLTEQKTRAALLSAKPQNVTIDQVLDSGRMRCTLTNEQEEELVYIKVQLLCCRVGSYRRQELSGMEAFKYLKKFLYKNVEISFEGSVEKYSQSYFVLMKTEDPETHKQILLNQVILEKGLAQFSYNKQATKGNISKLQNAAQKGKHDKVGVYRYDLDSMDFEQGSFTDIVLERVYGLNVVNRSLFIKFADEDEIDYQLTKDQKPLTYYEVGQLVLAMKGNYAVRAVIQQLDKSITDVGNDQQQQKKSTSNQIYVYYPDLASFGYVDAVYQISQEDADEPCQAIECHLCFVDHNYKFNSQDEEDIFLDELDRQLVSREFNAFFCGRDDRGILQLFAQFKDGDLDIQQTINTYLLEGGFVKSQEVPGGFEFFEDVSQYEQKAIQRRVGIWK